MALDTITTCAFKILSRWNVLKTPSGVVSSIRSDTEAEIGESLTFTLGTGANQANNIVYKDTTLAASASTTFDLRADLASVCNETGLLITAVKAMIIQNKTTTTSTLIKVGGAASNPWFDAASGPFVDGTSLIGIPNGGAIAFTNPSSAGSITDATHKALKILNADGTNSATVRMILFVKA